MDESKTERCSWADSPPLMAEYHDAEWGVPIHDDRALFELLSLEGAQAGLSWITILKRREGYRKAFANFDIDALMAFGPTDVERLLADPGIVRHRQKVESVLSNALLVRKIQAEFGSFDSYLWKFVGGAPILRRPETMSDVPVTSDEAKALSDDLRKRGFKFAGPTVCYSFMQAAGLINDHVVTCFRHKLHEQS